MSDDYSWSIRLAGEVILGITYGYDVTTDDDPLVALSEKASAEFIESVAVGAFFVDFIPISMSNFPIPVPFV